MLVDMGGGGVNEKITHYVSMGWGLQKFDLFYVKSAIFFMFFRQNVYIFNIFVHVNNVAPLNMLIWGEGGSRNPQKLIT